MELFDTHCHIQSAGGLKGERQTHDIWAKDPKLTIDRLIYSAHENAVQTLLLVGCDLDDSRLAVAAATAHKECYASIGIHPHEADSYASDPDALSAFSALLKDQSPKIVAIGECGLDYFYHHSTPEAQAAVLRFQLELAESYNLPVIFHVRKALDDFWNILKEYPRIRGVMHSFTDSAANLRIALERGLYIGVNGIATFSKDPTQQAVYKSIPIDRLLLETDAPFLTPNPYRGTINEPKQLKVIADYCVEMYAMGIEEVAAATTANANRLFGVKGSSL